MQQIVPCPVCKSRENELFLARRDVAVHQHLLMDSADAARRIRTGDLLLYCCSECGFIFNGAFEQSKLTYGDCYDNAQTWSPMFSNYLEEVISYLLQEHGIKDGRILEIGCGQGDFLISLVERGAGKCGCGFDPSYRGPQTAANGRITFCKDYFRSGSTDVQADIIICRHVIEHVPDPVALLAAIGQAMARESRSCLFLETPSATWILRNGVFWDFFYEHCAYFTAGSLARALKNAGLAVKKTREAFHGQYLWLEAGRCGENTGAADHAPVFAMAKQYARTEQILLEQWRAALKRNAFQGRKTAVWGAGGKGATFVSLVDPDCCFVDCVVDVNPHKQGKFVPGTGHPIVSPAALEERGVTAVIIMNSNYRAEVMETCRHLAPGITCVEVENEHEDCN